MKIPTKRAMRRLVASAALAISMSCAYSAETTSDIVIYGSSPAARCCYGYRTFGKRAFKTMTWNGEMWVDAMGNRVD